MHNKTTHNRLSSKQVSDLGIAIQEISGRKYAQQALLNYHDNMKLFKDRQSANDFHDHIREGDQ